MVYRESLVTVTEDWVILFGLQNVNNYEQKVNNNPKRHSKTPNLPGNSRK